MKQSRPLLIILAIMVTLMATDWIWCNRIQRQIDSDRAELARMRGR